MTKPAGTFKLPAELRMVTTYPGLRRRATTLAAVAVGVPWWMGDLFLFADTCGLEVRNELVDSFPGLDTTTLAKWMRVAEVFPVERRRPDCPWEWHEAVYRLPPAVADEILAEAEANGSSLQDVRNAATLWTRSARNPKRP